MKPFQLNRCPENPILKPNPHNAWEERAVLNPAMLYEDGTFYLYYRAAGNDVEHRIHIGLATSRDGVHFTRTSNQPLLTPKDGDFDGGCIEDPRIVTIDGVCFMTYAYRTYPPRQYWIKTVRHPTPTELFGLSPNTPEALVRNITSTGLAIVQNHTGIKKLGRITRSDVDDRDVLLFPERINGNFVRLSRPVKYSGDGYDNEKPAIWINHSPSIMDWDEKQTKLLMKGIYPWEERKIGASTPPIRTPEGWLLLYHGVDGQGVYRVGSVLLDLNDPCIILGRTREPILQPEMDYEKNGIYSGCVFPTGIAVVDDTLFVYYGGADQYCCLATCSLRELTAYTLSNS